VRDVQIDAVFPRAFQFRVDGTGDDVPGSEFHHRMHPFHEPFARPVEQFRPLAADRFRNEEGLGVRMIEAGGVELDEFHVGDRRTGPVGDGDAVPRGDVGVARVEIDFPGSPRGEDGGVREEGVDRPRLHVENVRADRLVLPPPVERLQLAASNEVDGGVVLVDPDAAVGPGAGKEGALHLAAGQVLGVEDPSLRVSPLASEVILLTPVPAGEPDPPLDQFPDLRGGVPYDHVHDFGVAEACPRPVGVLDMGFERVLAAPYRGDPPLGVVRAGFGGRPFRDDRYRSLPGRTEGETQPRDAASDDQIVGMPVHVFPPAGSPCRLTRGSAIY